MTIANGHTPANGAETPIPFVMGSMPMQYSPEDIHRLVAALEAPFDPHLVEWRVCSTSGTIGNLRGQLVAYSDSRAYQDRLNSLFTPAGWTRKYDRQTSGEFQRGRDQNMVAKVFVTCELTIHGLGSHSSTGEAWADDDHAGTTAEAQAFKRTASCFGLGRYLYDIEIAWVDLDDRKRPMSIPSLPKWATPEGWAAGLRPQFAVSNRTDKPRKDPKGRSKERSSRQTQKGNLPSEIVVRIEKMQQSVGHRLYRGILKSVAKVWNPGDIGDPTVEQQVLEKMDEAERWRLRFDTALQQIGGDAFAKILQSKRIRSFHQIETVEVFAAVVCAMEEHARSPY